MGDINFDLPAQEGVPAILSGGLWIISVTQFQQVYTRPRGPWDRAKEERYRKLLAHVLELETTKGKLTYQEGVDVRGVPVREALPHLRGREPEAEPGYTFLIFRLTDAEVMKALYEPVRSRERPARERPWRPRPPSSSLLHFAMAVGSKLHESTTSDEIVHLTGGYSYWKFDDYRLQPENGNLPQRWVALPGWIAGAEVPPWTRSTGGRATRGSWGTSSSTRPARTISRGSWPRAP
jgi:hypothetical protein